MQPKPTFSYTLLRFKPKITNDTINGNCFAIVRYIAKQHPAGSTIVLVSSLSRGIPLHAQLFVPTYNGFITYEFRPRAGFVITDDVPWSALQTPAKKISTDQIDHYMSALTITLSWLRGLKRPIGKSFSAGDERDVYAAYHIIS